MRILNSPILIQWDKFKPGTSFFIPCIDRHPVKRYIEAEAKRLRVPIVTKLVVEGGRYGVRAWRVDPDAGILAPHSSSPNERT